MKANGTQREAAQPVDVGAKYDEDGEEETEEVKVLEEVGSFNKIMAWGHEALVDGDDAFSRGIEEWTTFSQAVSFP